jgi:hypothetical protein
MSLLAACLRRIAVSSALSLAVGTLAASVALGDSPEALTTGLHHCAQEHDSTKRLACFDALAKTLPQVQADQFGLTAAIKAQRDPEEAHRAANESVTARIVGLGESGAGERIFTLDNGQVWIEAQPRPGVRFASGDTVRLEHGAMSSLWLAADHGRMTKVKRVR